MFSYSPSLTSLDLSSFNTEKVKDMNSMFEGCLALESLDLSSFNTANVTDMGSMFDGCSALESLDLRSFNTAKVTDMGFMFQDCQKLTLLDLTNFDFSKVQNFESMFYELGREAENQPIPVYVTAAGYNILLKDEKTDINQWYAEYAVPGHLPAGSTFKAAVNSFLESNSSLTKIKFIANSNNTNKDNRIGTSEPYMVAGSDNTLEIHTAEAEFVFNKDCSRMFSYLTNIQSIDFGNCVNTANVIDMFFMFQDCSSLTSLDLSSFNTSNVTKMYNMFDGCTKLTSLDLSNFNTTSVTNMCNMFYSCNKLASLNLLSFDFSKVQYFDYMFYELGKEVENQPIPVYVTAAGYDILSQEDTYYAYYYAQYVDEDGDPY